MLSACKQITTDFGLWRRLRRISLESEIWLFGFFNKMISLNTTQTAKAKMFRVMKNVSLIMSNFVSR